MNKKTLVIASAAAVFASGVALANATQSASVNPTAQVKIAPQYAACGGSCASSCASSCAASSCSGCGGCSGSASCGGCASDDTDD